MRAPGKQAQRHGAARTSGATRPACVRRGFTLVELMLVLAILGVVTAVTMPTFVRSIRGHRLQTAARTITMAGRYARSMAVLAQREVSLELDLDNGTVVVCEAGLATNAPPEEAGVPPPHTDAAPAGTEAGDGSATAKPADAEAVESGPAVERVERKLDRVKIAEVTVEGAETPMTEGKCIIPYHGNGTCLPYALRIVDEYHSAIRVQVDALSTAETASEDHE